MLVFAGNQIGIVSEECLGVLDVAAHRRSVNLAAEGKVAPNQRAGSEQSRNPCLHNSVMFDDACCHLETTSRTFKLMSGIGFLVETIQSPKNVCVPADCAIRPVAARSRIAMEEFHFTI
jgi:hypothetical protein